jgi:eukaryotic-like serine/threonine-protein kinase
MYCPKCGKEIKEQSAFCAYCGGNIAEMITPPAAVRTPAPGAPATLDLDSTQALPPEQGRYQRMSLIGIGGMGRVYKAWDTVMEEWIALKTLPPELNEDPKLLALFIREARNTRKLAHPNIIRVHDVEEIGGVNYISMEYVDGGDLKTFLQQHQPLSFDLAAKLLYQLAAALHHSHSQNIIHRDLKPQNILLDQNHQVKVSDFGIAKALDDTGVTKTGAMMGTAAYMSPEHLGAGAIDHRSDLYSLGVILYEMLTGEMPFKADTPIGLGFKHLQDVAPSPRQLRQDTPPVLEQVALKCLAKRPEDRFQSARDLILFLRNPQATSPVPVAPRPPAPAPPPVSEPDLSLDTREAEKIANSAGMHLQLIEPGEFVMGSNLGPDNERPPHPVRITYPFYLGMSPVTQQQYELVMKSNPSHFKGGPRPVENVTWTDARKFCQQLSLREGSLYRLPSEAEWEYAARAGSTAEYFWGDGFNMGFTCCLGNSGRATNEVGRLKPNKWGLHDMAGNVWEWCEDNYAPVYSAGAQTDPAGPRAGAERVMRGGAFDSEPGDCRCASRKGLAAKERKENLGFRVVREYDPQRRLGKLMIRLILGDLTIRKAEAIVNTTSCNLTLSGAVSRALLVAAGPELKMEMKKYPAAALGSVVKTAAGNLPARFLYHAVINERDGADHFRPLMRNLLTQAGYDRIEAMTMPLIGMALVGVEPEQALTMIMDNLAANSGILAMEVAVDIVILDRQIYHRLLPLFLKHRPKSSA